MNGHGGPLLDGLAVLLKYAGRAECWGPCGAREGLRGASPRQAGALIPRLREALEGAAVVAPGGAERRDVRQAVARLARLRRVLPEVGDRVALGAQLEGWATGVDSEGFEAVDSAGQGRRLVPGARAYLAFEGRGN